MSAETPGRRTQTAKEAAKLLNVSERTIRNIVAEPWDDYIARAEERRARAVELRKQGLKYRQIAEQMGISKGSVGTLIHHARKHGELDVPLYTRPAPTTEGTNAATSAKNSSA